MQPQPLPTVAPTPRQSSTESLSLENPWPALLVDTPLSEGWHVSPCDEMTPFLCVDLNGATVGRLELSIYPLQTLPDFQQMLADTQVATDALAIHHPETQTKVLAALQTWVSDYYQTVKNDRLPIYGDAIQFQTDTPTEIDFGSLKGWRYGWSGVKGDRSLSEKHVGYVAFDGDQLYIITTIYDGSDNTGTFATLADLQQFEPELMKIVSHLRL